MGIDYDDTINGKEDKAQKVMEINSRMSHKVIRALTETSKNPKSDGTLRYTLSQFIRQSTLCCDVMVPCNFTIDKKDFDMIYYNL